MPEQLNGVCYTNLNNGVVVSEEDVACLAFVSLKNNVVHFVALS